ncbi:hypothetical protein C8J57DRAFT_1252102 [Mycena rebaudengoi]|nr:hypothetical protein C8J57DRAFT_1252102 [Mycena rebaudengoi]
MSVFTCEISSLLRWRETPRRAFNSVDPMATVPHSESAEAKVFGPGGVDRLRGMYGMHDSMTYIGFTECLSTRFFGVRIRIGEVAVPIVGAGHWKQGAGSSDDRTLRYNTTASTTTIRLKSWLSGWGPTLASTSVGGAGVYRTAMHEEDSEQENTSHDAQQSEEGVSRNHTECYLANNARVIDSMGAVDHAPNFGVHSTRTYIAMAHLNTWISRARGGKGSREEMINGTMRIRRSESDTQLEQCVQGDTDEADVHDARVQCFKLTRDTTSECGGAVGKREAVWGLT